MTPLSDADDVLVDCRRASRYGPQNRPDDEPECVECGEPTGHPGEPLCWLCQEHADDLATIPDSPPT